LPIEPMKMALIRRRMSAKSSGASPDWTGIVVVVMASSQRLLLFAR
jgi:hypothetical protein